LDFYVKYKKLGLRIMNDAYASNHVAANFALRYSDVDAKRLLMNAAYTKSELDLTYWFRRLVEVDRGMCAWAERMELEHWAQYMDSDATNLLIRDTPTSVSDPKEYHGEWVIVPTRKDGLINIFN
ncbi:hypothetical protein PIB30_077390, partial [Stylosanthes scabra]|nr:hypothetical protein [Stylosanthes scabra]